MGAGVAIDFYSKMVGINIELTDEHLLKELRSLMGSRQELIPNLIGMRSNWAGIEIEPNSN